VTAPITNFVVTNDQYSHRGVLPLNERQSLHEGVKTAQSFKITIHKCDCWHRPINPHPSHFVIHPVIWAGKLRINPLMDHPHPRALKLRWKALRLMASGQHPGHRLIQGRPG